MLDFRIETFLEVCRVMNFTKAAKRLHITQPAVSQHIHALERQYKTKLFEHVGKQLFLTEAVRMVLQTATTRRHDAQHLQDTVAQLASSRRICFGATLTVGEYIMPEPLTRLLEREPDTRLCMTVANTSELLRLLDQGKIDFAIVEGFFQKQAYDSMVYRTEKYLAVCAPGNTHCSSVQKLEDLLEERLLVREPGSGTREVLQRALEERNLTVEDFRLLTELGSLNAIKSMVCAGIGISFFYQPVVQTELDAGLLVEIPLQDFSVTHNFTFLWRKKSVFASYYRHVFDLMQQASSAPLPKEI